MTQCQLVRQQRGATLTYLYLNGSQHSVRTLQIVTKGTSANCSKTESKAEEYATMPQSQSVKADGL